MLPLGLMLNGGGARGAYQAGVLRGLGELLSEMFPNEETPFSVFSGVSAGAINAVHCAASPHSFMESTKILADLWSHLKPEKVYRTDFASLGKIGFHVIRDVAFGSFSDRKMAAELLDSTPLKDLLDRNVTFPQISTNLANQRLRGIAVTAYNYSVKKTVTWVQAMGAKPWDREKRFSENVTLRSEHILASCSIPLLFPPTEVSGHFFGDGSLRNPAPLSPIIHLGCQKCLIVGVRGKTDSSQAKVKRPSMGEILGTLLNGLFFDSFDIDIERMRAINQLTPYLGSETSLKKINWLYIRPSVDLGALAADLAPKNLPFVINYLLRGLGGKKELNELTSYIFFDRSYTEKLVDIGYQDVMLRKNELIEFFEDNE